MKTTMNLSILWSVLALSLLVCAVESAASPTNSLFKLDTYKSTKLSTTGDKISSHWIPSSASPRSRPGSRWPDTPPAVRQEALRANIQSDIAYLPDVSVTCSTSDFVVRVKPAFYGLGVHTGQLKLGDTCKSNGVLRPYGDLLFTYPLTACGAVRQVWSPCAPTSTRPSLTNIKMTKYPPQSPPGFVVYKLVLHYEPSVKRFPGIDVDIECRYPRFGSPVVFSVFVFHGLHCAALNSKLCPGTITCTSWACSPPGKLLWCRKGWKDVQRNSTSSWWTVGFKKV